VSQERISHVLDPSWLARLEARRKKSCCERTELVHVRVLQANQPLSIGDGRGQRRIPTRVQPVDSVPVQAHGVKKHCPASWAENAVRRPIRPWNMGKKRPIVCV